MRGVVLRDGTSAWLRQAQPSDASLLEALFERSSSRSLLLRFFTPLRQVDRSLIERLATPNAAGGMAYVVTHGLGADEAVIAVGNYFRLPRGDTADVAFFVDDDHQGKYSATAAWFGVSRPKAIHCSSRLPRSPTMWLPATLRRGSARQ